MCKERGGWGSEEERLRGLGGLEVGENNKEIFLEVMCKWPQVEVEERN